MLPASFFLITSRLRKPVFIHCSRHCSSAQNTYIFSATIEDSCPETILGYRNNQLPLNSLFLPVKAWFTLNICYYDKYFHLCFKIHSSMEYPFKMNNKARGRGDGVIGVIIGGAGGVLKGKWVAWPGHVFIIIFIVPAKLSRF